MKHRNGITGLLVAIHLGLAVWMVLSVTGSHQRTQATLASDGKAGADAPQSLSPGEAGHFHWRHVASSNLRLYIERLRRIQCPEDTVRDIILAEIDRLYRAKEGAVRDASDASARRGTGVRSVDESARIRALRFERKALTLELLGIDVPVDIPSPDGRLDNDPFEGALSVIPAAKRDRTRAIHEKYEALLGRMRSRISDPWLPEEVAEYQRLLAARRAELGIVLTPEELDEVEVRSHSSALALRKRWGAGFQPTDAEFKAMFHLQRDFDETYSVAREVLEESGSTPARTAAARLQLDANLRQVLGEERYKEYARSIDWNFKNLSEAASDLGLPQEVAVRAYDYLKSARRQFSQFSSQMLANPSLTVAQRTELLGQYQAGFEQQIRSMFGDEGFRQIQPRLPRFGPRPGSQ